MDWGLLTAKGLLEGVEGLARHTIVEGFQPEKHPEKNEVVEVVCVGCTTRLKNFLPMGFVQPTESMILVTKRYS
jgi:hypothetical protein